MVLLVILGLTHFILENHNTCYGVQTIDVKVDQNGIVTKYTLTTDTDRSAYRGLTIRLLAKTGLTYKDLARDYSDTYHETWQGDYVRMVTSMNKPLTVDVTCTNEYCTYRHTFTPYKKGLILNSWWDEYYYLEMPGTIVGSNADTVFNNTAIWHTNSFTLGSLYAKSTLPHEEEDPFHLNGEMNYTVNYNGPDYTSPYWSGRYRIRV